MKTNLTNIAFAEIDLDFDEKEFTEDFDNFILPRTEPFVPVHIQWMWMAKLNKYWNLLPEEQFIEYDNIINSGGTNLNGSTHYWDAIDMMESTGFPKTGVGSMWRSQVRFNKNNFKTEFQNSKIATWIVNNIPAKKIVGIRCITLKPGGFATMHRDVYWNQPGPNPASKNGFFRDGFVVVCLNITDGGVPLLWALDHEKEHPRKANSKCYVGNDYFLHGVPVTTSRRRQVRISFQPTEEFYSLIKSDTIISLPDDYCYH